MEHPDEFEGLLKSTERVKHDEETIDNTISKRSIQTAREPVANFWYLVVFTATVALSSIQYGFIYSQTAAIISYLQEKLNWNQDETSKWMTLLQTCSIIGIALGSVFGG